MREHANSHISRFSFFSLSSAGSLFSTHCLNCVSRKRHCPPTLKAGSSPLRIIRCSVRVETCKRVAASERVSKRMFSSFSSIENFLRRAKRNVNASKNFYLTGCFGKGNTTGLELFKYKNGQPETNQDCLVQ